MAELRAWLGWAVTRIGYVIRPYDALADRRRWRWQRRHRCRVFWCPPDGRPAIDITDRVAARHVPGRCDRICLDIPAGPCADECVMEWAARVRGEADDGR